MNQMSQKVQKLAFFNEHVHNYNSKILKQLDNKSVLLKKNYKLAIKSKNDIEINLKNNQYRITQKNLKKIITD